MRCFPNIPTTSERHGNSNQFKSKTDLRGDADESQATWIHACKKGCLAGLKLNISSSAGADPVPNPVPRGKIFGGDFVPPGLTDDAAHINRPDFANMPRFGTVPREWVVMRQEGTGRPFYRNSWTGESTWAEPVGTDFGGVGT